jgi:hypothetical protein
MGSNWSALYRAAVDVIFRARHNLEWCAVEATLGTSSRLVVLVTWELNDADPRAGISMTYKGLLAPDVFARTRPRVYSYMKIMDTRETSRDQSTRTYICFSVSPAHEQQFESDRARAESEIVAAGIGSTHAPIDGVRTWVGTGHNLTFYTQFDRVYDADVDSNIDIT